MAVEKEQKEQAPVSFSLRQQVFSFLTGMSLMGFLTLLGGGIQESVEMINFFNFLTPLTLAFVGLGTGHYIGLSYEESATDRRLFYLGAFIAIAGIMVVASRDPVFGYIPPGFILLAGSVFTIFSHLSGLIDNYEDFEAAIEIASGDISRAYLVLLTVLKYGISFILNIIDNVPKLDLFGQAVVLGLIVVAIYLSMALKAWVELEEETSQSDD